MTLIFMLMLNMRIFLRSVTLVKLLGILLRIAMHNRKVPTVVTPSAPATVAEGGKQIATDEDPLIEYMIKAKEVALNMVGDVMNPEGETSISSEVVQPVQ
ncbi:hypothetical protein L195_g046686, partial [Trifolium pratense]